MKDLRSSLRERLYGVIRPVRTRYFNQLLEADETALEAWQRHRLSGLLEHARINTRYYGELLKDDFSANPFETLSHLPILTKERLRTEFDGLLSRDSSERGAFVNRSGGSTGTPVKFVQDKDTAEWKQAVSRLFDSWAGADFGVRRALLWGSERDLIHGSLTLRTQVSQRVRNELSLNAFRMSPEGMARHIEALNQFRPEFVLGYADALYEIARFAQDNQLSIHSPNSVMASAGTLYPHMKSKVQDVFGAPVFNRYGTREFGGIACEKSGMDGLHVSVSTHVVEILDANQTPITEPDQVGEVVVTGLTNFSMPLIRYATGDLGAWSEDSVGRVLKFIDGRKVDVLYRSDGGIVLPEYVIHILGVVMETPEVGRYQIVQSDFHTVTIYFEQRSDNFRGFQSWSEEIREKMELVFGIETDITLEKVREIPALPSGKYVYVKNEITHTPRS